MSTSPTVVTWAKPIPILVDLPDELLGDRILVRPFRSGDGAAMFEAVEESREHIEPWLPWGPFHKTADDSEIQARKFAYRWLSRETLSMSIWDKVNGRFLGGVELRPDNWDVPSFEIGYWLRKSAEGHGYMTEAVALVTSMAFDFVKANRVFIRCATQNPRSAAVPKRLGYVHEGTIRNWSRNTRGELYDLEIYALTPEDWAGLQLRSGAGK